MHIFTSPIISYFFVCILGILLHFTYNWSNQNFIVGLFSAKNESVWEHLKLIFFPLLLLTVIQIVLTPNFLSQRFSARTISTLAGMGFIMVCFYVVWGITGRLIGVVNISIYFLGVLFAFLIEKEMSKTSSILDISYCFLLWATITIAFICFSIKAPNIGLFYDLKKHPKSI